MTHSQIRFYFDYLPIRRAAVLIAVALLLIAGLSACSWTEYRDHGGNTYSRYAPRERVTTAEAPRSTATYPGRDRFPDADPGPATSVTRSPVSTFAADVDTASYAVVRRFLKDGKAPPVAAVRVEEMVNYFPYDYPARRIDGHPFAIGTEITPTPWNQRTHLLHIAIATERPGRYERPPLNLVLLVDVSGSMQPDDRLPLLKEGFKGFLRGLNSHDRISIVTYANGVSTPLDSARGSDTETIARAIDDLEAGGGTNGSRGLERAYDLADRNFDPRAVNRVVLATDGDFNIGITDRDELKRFVSKQRRKGIYLSVMGVGLGNLNDSTMQTLAQWGNGNAAYIDSLLEARKVLNEQTDAVFVPVADDVKFQVEFNPSRVRDYRLVGYETRALRREDFNNDRVDAGEVGAGHTVTALYEITLTGADGRYADPPRYRGNRDDATGVEARSDELAFVRIRYKEPGRSDSRIVTRPVTGADLVPSLMAGHAEHRFAAAVAAFGELLRGAPADMDEGYGFRDVEALAQSARGDDRDGYRAEFIQLVRLAGGIRKGW